MHFCNNFHLSLKFLKPVSSCFQAWVYFYPTEDQQKTCDGCGEQGMNGDLVIVYDVNRDTSLGDIKVKQEFISWMTPGLLALLKIPYLFKWISSPVILTFFFLSLRHQLDTLFITLLHLVFPAYQKMLSSLLIKVAQ